MSKINISNIFARLFAFIIDQIIIILIVIFIYYFLNNWLNINNKKLINMIVVIISFILTFAYFIFFHKSYFRATPGKIIIGIQLYDPNKSTLDFQQLLIRVIIKILSGIFCYIPWLIAIFTPNKQALHDIISRTFVVKKKENYSIFYYICIFITYFIIIVIIIFTIWMMTHTYNKNDKIKLAKLKEKICKCQIPKKFICDNGFDWIFYRTIQYTNTNSSILTLTKSRISSLIVWNPWTDYIELAWDHNQTIRSNKLYKAKTIAIKTHNGTNTSLYILQKLCKINNENLYICYITPMSNELNQAMNFIDNIP